MGNVLPREAYIEFQQIYQTLYGVELTYEEAVQKGTKLFEIFRNIYKPIPKKLLTSRRKSLKYETNIRKKFK